MVRDRKEVPITLARSWEAYRGKLQSGRSGDLVIPVPISSLAICLGLRYVEELILRMISDRPITMQAGDWTRTKYGSGT